MLCTGRIYFPYLSHPFWFWGPSYILSCQQQGLFHQGYTGQRLKLATYFHLVLRLEMHYSLSTFVEQFLVHIFLHFNFSYWKSHYICVEVEGSTCIRSFYVLLQPLSGLLWPARQKQNCCLTVIWHSASRAPPFSRPRT